MLKDINFFISSDDEYKKDYFIRHYKNALNIIVKLLKLDDIITTNQELHEFHKKEFGPISLKEKDKYSVEDYYEFLKKVDEYWNNKLKISIL